MGVYAGEHEFPREASQAFAETAKVGGPLAARASALAGLNEVFLDREAAREYLTRARDEGLVLLADVGLTVLDAPEGDSRAFPVPRSMVEATDAELDAEPTVLNFLGELAVRRGDLTEAVEWRRRALRASVESAATTRLMLAGTLLRRVYEDDPRSRKDLREALQLAQLATEERRRWDGPSASALAFIVQTHIGFQDLTQAVRVALPESMGGTAQDREVKTTAVARHGAVAALMAPNADAYAFFMEQLPDGPHKHEICAMEEELKGAPPERCVELYSEVLDEADDEMASRCLTRLASWCLVRTGRRPA